MTVLQALNARYNRLADKGEAPVPGFGPAQISFVVVLSADGEVVTVDDLRVGDTEKKKRPLRREAPQPPKRTVAVASGAFWDKTSYVFGRSAPDPRLSPEKQAKAEARTAQEHEAFKARHEAMIGDSADPGLVALLRFLRSWQPQAYETLLHVEVMLDQNVAFQLDGDIGFIHDRAAARAAFVDASASTKGAPEAMCLVTGHVGPVARLHPSIKGVPGAQSSGAALVSFNLDAFNSYGKTQGFNAPVSEAAAFAYATALNALIAEKIGTDPKGRPLWRNRVALGEDTIVFWAETEKAEAVARGILDPRPANEITETDAVRTRMRALEQGEPLEKAAPDVEASTRVYILGLSPNAARLSVRFWLDQSLGELATNFQNHWKDFRLEPAPRKDTAIPIWMLLQELAVQRKVENTPQILSGDILRAIVTGDRYPASLFAQTIMRIRADQDRIDPSGRTLEKVSGVRVAILKACLARDYRKGLISEDAPMSLDPKSENLAYQLGRMFAVLERLQRAALGQRNATIRDRFYSSASANPERIYPLLIRNAKNHSKSIRTKIGPALAEWFENKISEVAGMVNDAFPKTLTLQDQGRFALGYYHQREFFRQKRADIPAELVEADIVADQIEDEQP